MINRRSFIKRTSQMSVAGVAALLAVPNIQSDAGPVSPSQINLDGPLCLVYSSLFNVMNYKCGRDSDSDAVRKAIAALERQGGGVLYFPARTYDLEGIFVINNTQVKLCGDGIGLSILRFSTRESGFSIQQGFPDPVGNENWPTTICDLSFHAAEDFSSYENNAALVIRYGDTGARTHNRCIIERVDIRGAEKVGNAETVVQDAGWRTGIIMENCHNSFMRGCSVVGRPITLRAGDKISDQPPSFAGVLFRNLGINQVPTDFKVSQCNFFSLQNALLLTGDIEGMYITQCTGVQVNYFVNCLFAPTEEGQDVKPLVFVTQSHCACRAVAVNFENVAQAWVMDNLFYIDPSTNPKIDYPVGVNVNERSHDIIIARNIITNQKPEETDGLNGIIVGGDNVQILDNNIGGKGILTGIWLRGPSSNCVVLDNFFHGVPHDSQVVNHGVDRTNIVRSVRQIIF